MPSFNQQVQDLKASGSSYSVFVEGIKPKYLSGDAPILFRLLPAYNYDDKDAVGDVNPAGYLPCRLPNGDLTPWGAILWLNRGVGHGSGKGNTRRDYVSPATFGSNAFDPIAHLFATASADAEWNYLVKDQNDAGGKLVERACIGRPGEHLIANIVELSAGGLPEASLGVMSKSACDALVSPHKNGLLFQRANNVTEDMIRQNYLVQWSCGDVTDPREGPVLRLEKGKENGKMSKYQVKLAEDNRGFVRRLPLGPEILECRYDLTDISRLLVKRTDEETIQLLIETFTGRSPRGYHEYSLLKAAFGHMAKIPEPPQAPGASPTIQSGLAPASGGFGQAPASSGSYLPSGFGPAPAQPGGFAPGRVAGPVGPTPSAPVNPPQTAPGVTNAVDAAAAALQAPAAAPAQAAPGSAAPGPSAPGDPQDEARKAAFLQRVRKAGPTGPAR